MDKIRVGVRVRPFNRRERELGTESVITMQNNNQCCIRAHNSSSSDKHYSRTKPGKVFTFDHCFDVEGDNSDQEAVYIAVGRGLLDNAFDGYNACILAYGQTGSGKSYTMMGTENNKGLIPRLCDELFARIAALEQSDANTSCKVEVSFMELYNEKLNDLLDPSKDNRQALKIREFNKGGIVVNGLCTLAVTSYVEIERLIKEGNAARTVASTNMNAESSRSHAVFNVLLTQTVVDVASGVSGAKVSKLSLVDLAGSERASKTGAVGERLREGSNINRSLSTLGLVISKLAERDSFIPYRDSQLTLLLRDNLGGNSRTVMIATISPSSDNYEETLSTLRYANQAKRIVNNAVVNEDQNGKIIRELREEVDNLKGQLMSLQRKHTDGSGSVSVQEASINEKLHESEKLITNLSQTWEDKLKKTEQVQHERQQALEKMGISVQTSGISVQKDKYYLVNLNADPSLNEMLVYYLKERSHVGRPGIPGNDIQLTGVGITPHHCTFTIEANELFLEPSPDAKNYVNGVQITSKTKLRNGDRVVWGFNYYFRVNCPRTYATGGPSEPQTPAQPIDYNFAREELMLNELSNDPIQVAIQTLERQHEEDKQMALEKQRQEYEKQFQQLRNIMSPTTPYAPYTLPPYDQIRGGARATPCTPNSQHRMEKWAQEREDVFRRCLTQLRQDIMTASNLVQQANFLSNELKKQTKFEVTLQIPPQNLSPNRKKSSFVSEPAIRVKRRGRPSQVWTMEKLEHKLIIMRELHEEQQNLNTTNNNNNINNTENSDSNTSAISQNSINNNINANMNDSNNSNASPTSLDSLNGEAEPDPFYDSQENHNLIGVANIFLECLFNDVKLGYHVPIISQQAEVAGRLLVEVSRIAGHFPQERFADTLSDSSSSDSGADADDSRPRADDVVTVRVSIRQATSLPPSLSHFVFCQYQMWGQQEAEVVAPVVDNDYPPHPSTKGESISFKFDHTKDFRIPVTEDFLEHCVDGALSLEVWGHRSAGFVQSHCTWEVDHQLAKARSLADRWRELTRKIEFWVEVQELGDSGGYESVEVGPQKDVLTGGVYQLRQGQQRRIVCKVKPVPNSGTLPIICQSISSVSIGSVTVRVKLQRQLDSYSEEDLTVLKQKWSKALQRRRTYLHQQLQKVMIKSGVDQSSLEQEREQSLVEQLVSLTEEQNAVQLPPPGSNIPGAPADWTPPIGKEAHIPVIFLNLNGDDFSSQVSGEFISLAGTNAIIPKEMSNKFFNLPIVEHYDDEVCAVASWDSSIHNNPLLNRQTSADERVYLIVKSVVRLSHPVMLDIVLRKRICVNIYKKQSLTSKFVRSFIGTSNTYYDTAVIYEIVSNIPKASEELEERESLAQMAANDQEANTEDGDTYIEKYTKGVTSVESILLLDRLRQSVAVKELLRSAGRPLMRKTASVPNFSNLFGSVECDLNKSCGMPRSGSVVDLNGQLVSGGGNSPSTPTDKPKHRYSLPSPSERPYGLSSPSPGPVKMAPRMTTLHEEAHSRPLLRHQEEDEEEDEEMDGSIGGAGEDAGVGSYRGGGVGSRLAHSRTFDSLHEMAAAAHGGKIGTPSTMSSGYGSGAVSSSTLSDDSLSVRSGGCLDDTPDRDSPVGGPNNTTANTDGVSIYSSGESDSSDTKTVVQADAASLLNIPDPPCDSNSPLQPSSPSSVHQLSSPLSHPLADLTNATGKSEETISDRGHDSSDLNTSLNFSQTCTEINASQHNADLSRSELVYSDKRQDIENQSLNDMTNNKIKENQPVDSDSMTSSGYSEYSGHIKVIKDNYMMSNSNEMNTSAPPNLLNAALTTSVDSSYQFSSSQTSLSENSDVNSVAESIADSTFDMYSTPEPSNNKREYSNNLSPSSSTSSLSNYSYSANSCSSSPMSYTATPAVVMRRSSAAGGKGKGPRNPSHRMSFPLAHHAKAAARNINGGASPPSASTETVDKVSKDTSNLPYWCQVGESVRIRPYDYTGVLAFLGTTHFSKGNITAGIVLDMPVGKNDGSVEDERYFECDPKFGLFVRPDKLYIDRKGRAARGSSSQGVSNTPMSRQRPLQTSTTMGSLAAASGPSLSSTSSSMKRSKSTAEKLSDSAMRRSSSKSKLNITPDNA